MVSHWNLSDSKSPQVSKTLLTILADLNNAEVWIVSTWPLISISSSPCTNPFGAVQSELITIGITVTFVFHSFSVLYTGLGYYYYYHYFFFFFTPWEFFTSAVADGLPLEFEWLQVSSSLQDSSHYSGRSQHCCSLDSFHSSRYFQVLQRLYQSFGDCSKITNYNWYKRHFRVQQFFQFPSKVEVVIPLFKFFLFYPVVHRNSKVRNPSSALLL